MESVFISCMSFLRSSFKPKRNSFTSFCWWLCSLRFMEPDRDSYCKYNNENFYYKLFYFMKRAILTAPDAVRLFRVFNNFLFCHFEFCVYDNSCFSAGKAMFSACYSGSDSKILLSDCDWFQCCAFNKFLCWASSLAALIEAMATEKFYVLILLATVMFYMLLI